MALIDLFSISKQFDDKKLLENIDFHLHQGERVAIIGQNGCGKSSFMKIAYGDLEPDDGKRIVGNEVQIEMLAQVPKYDDSLTVRQAIENELTELKKVRKRYDALLLLLESDFDNNALQLELEELTNFLDYHNAWSLDNKVEQILIKFRLKQYEKSKINNLSGGEQRRVSLAGIILKKPDVLILDEPTNHLDIEMVRFLEEIILKEKFTILFVSHDRYFIDNIATQIVEVEHHQLKKYQGGYADFLRQKEEYLKTLEKQQHNLEKELASEMAWLNKGVKARTKRNVGRVKRVHELKAKTKTSPGAISRMKNELLREKIGFVESQKSNSRKIFFDIYNISYKIADRTIINKFKAKILQRDCIAIVGANGAGKSTLLKLLLGRIKPDEGTIKKSEFKIGYFDQNRENLDDDKDIISTFCPNGGDRVDVGGKNIHVYGYLKGFNFPSEDLTKRIGMLSGGERNRVALALLFTKEVGCIILDEPTNDLDIQTINILEEKLAQFKGVVIFVSHDRYFVDKLAKKLFIFEGNGEISESYQKYTEYLDIQKNLEEVSKLEKQQINNKTSQTSAPAEKYKQNKKQTYKEKYLLENLPNDIEILEKKIIDLNHNLIENMADSNQVIKISSEMNSLQQQLNEKEEKYLELLEKF